MGLLTETKNIKEIENGSILSPKGFFAGGTHAGLRYSKKDLGLIYSEVPASSAAVYTTNHFQAAPIKVTQDSIGKEGIIQAVIANSACANACTGEKGLKDAYEMRKLTANKLNIDEHYVAVASTGVIGEYLNMEKISAGIKKLTLSQEAIGADDFETAILTTDTCTKQCAYTGTIDGKTVHIGGAAKGSGMIHPNMATMLAFITTDVNIAPQHLHHALREVTDDTFNQITVDGDTSTNDMVLVMANGLAENELLTPNHPDWPIFVELLSKTCESLAKQIAKDGEGATKLVEVEVLGAKTKEDAQKIAKQIVGSNLVKTAIFGTDANWGRIIGAVGQTDAFVNPENVSVQIGSEKMLDHSKIVPFSEEKVKQYLEEDIVKIVVHLHVGSESGKAWGCDLTYDYVKINASYRT